MTIQSATRQAPRSTSAHRGESKDRGPSGQGVGQTASKRAAAGARPVEHAGYSALRKAAEATGSQASGRASRPGAADTVRAGPVPQVTVLESMQAALSWIDLYLSEGDLGALWLAREALESMEARVATHR